MRLLPITIYIGTSILIELVAVGGFVGRGCGSAAASACGACRTGTGAGEDRRRAVAAGGTSLLVRSFVR